MQQSEAGPAPVNVFVAQRGNGFMRDIAEWLVEAAATTGRSASLIDSRLPTADGAINLVVAPHEFFELFDAPKKELQRAAAASFPVCTEQPGTPWFRLTVEVCQRGLYALDINSHGVDALRRYGINAVRLALGAVPSMSANNAESRPLDVLFMGGIDDRRGALLAEIAPHLFRYDHELRLFKFDHPVGPTTPGLVFGRDKFRLLSSSKILLNIHRDRSANVPAGADPSPYFEWARMVEAMANGCVVVSEPSEGFEPLQPGVHFIEAHPGEMHTVVNELLTHPERRAAIAAAAAAAVNNELALHRSLGPILADIETSVLPGLTAHVASGRYTRGVWRLGASLVPPPVRLGPFRPYLRLQQHAKHIALAENQALRDLDATSCVLHHGARQHSEEFTTGVYAAAIPEVSVVVSLYNYADLVVETLDSIVASEGVQIEIVIVEDHATDDSREVVQHYLTDHPGVAMLLITNDANEGLAAARNKGFARARAPKVMVIDADNLIYPTCLRKLADALEAHPEMAAAYSILEDFGAQRNVRSALAWDPARICAANYIDAQAMFRRETWHSLGGYRADDDHVFGWEDWDLWLRMIEANMEALLVPQILGRYRVQASSMIALTNLATDDAIQAIRVRYPTLPWPTQP